MNLLHQFNTLSLIISSNMKKIEETESNTQGQDISLETSNMKSAKTKLLN